MSGQVKRLLSPLKPVCDVVKSYSGLLTTVLFCVIVFSMLPLHLVWKSNVQKNVIDKVNSFLTSSFGQLLVLLLFICLYVNNDVKNMVLLLYVFWLTNQ